MTSTSSPSSQLPATSHSDLSEKKSGGYDPASIFRFYNGEPQEIRESRLTIRSTKDFEKIKQIGEGTYGRVFSARDIKNNRIVAIKKILNHRTEGFPLTAVREMNILRDCASEHVIPLYEVVMGKNSVYFVFEYMDYDLEALSRNPSISLSYSQIKCFLQQILEGLKVVHERGYMHRDLKGSNILMNSKGEIKLADFGFARGYTTHRDFTNHRMTLSFRPPEILLGCREYGPPADMWSIGCILAELLLREPLLPAKTEVDQIHRIYKLCGVPDRSTWPEVTSYESWHLMKPAKKYPRQLKFKLNGLPEDAVDFIDKCLQLNPKERITCEDALKHQIFTTDPRPATREELPKYDACHTYTLYQERKRKREQTEMTDSPQIANKKHRSSLNNGNVR